MLAVMHIDTAVISPGAAFVWSRDFPRVRNARSVDRVPADDQPVEIELVERKIDLPSRQVTLARMPWDSDEPPFKAPGKKGITRQAYRVGCAGRRNKMTQRALMRRIATASDR